MIFPPNELEKMPCQWLAHICAVLIPLAIIGLFVMLILVRR